MSGSSPSDFQLALLYAQANERNTPQANDAYLQASAARGAADAQQNGTNVADGAGGGLNLSLPTFGFGPWWAQRQRASFRGVPFVITENNMRRGRQIALHVYPFRDDPWPEDLGRSPRITSFRGFVVGDDADAQMKALMGAVETPGPGQLIHPTLGAFAVTVLQFTCSDSADRGRMWTFDMTVTPFIVRIYPVASANTQAATQGLFGSFGAAVAKDFAAVSSTINQVKTAVGGVVQTVQGYAAQAQGLIHDATSLAHLPAALAGNFGRFAGGKLAVNVPGTNVLTTFAQASGTINGAFASVGRISGTLSGLASKL